MQDPAACEKPEITIYSNSIWLEYTIPAQFPAPAKNVFHIQEDWSLACPTISGEWHQAAGEGFLRYGDGLTAHFNGGSDSPSFFYSSGYKYPSIKEGFFFNAVNLVVDANAISARTVSWYGTDAVVAARVNGGALQPLYFDGKVSSIPYTRGDVIELYSKGIGAQWGQITLDTGTDTVRFKRKAAFPAS